MRNIQIGIFVIFIFTVLGLPVQKKEPPKERKEQENSGGLEDVLEYERYLKEVVEALESDPDFRKKLDKAPEADIRSGKIAQELEYVSHNVRSRLDEIKRREIERLRQLASKQFELTNDIDRDHLKITEHLNHENDQTFEIDDLKKLILKTSKDLAEADKKRREEFKQYELQKEFEKQQVLKELDENSRKKYEEELQQLKEKHNKHEKVHHPGNKAQLEEVWEKQDHMDGQEFDPRAFFAIHDVDSNGYWDEVELKALFVKELDKIYQAGMPEDDLRERAEEMERMREHVFRESDTNNDGLISYQEFLDQTKREEFRRDPGWETVDNVPQFTHEEYLEYEKKRQEEVQRLIEQGVLPPTPKIPSGYQTVPHEVLKDSHLPPSQHTQQPQYQQPQYQHQPQYQQQSQYQQQPQYQQHQQPPQYQQQQQHQQPPQYQQQQQHQQPPQYQQQQQHQQPPQYQQQQQHQQPPQSTQSTQKPQQQQPASR